MSLNTYLQSSHFLEIITNKNISKINQIGKYLVRSIPHQFIISRVLAFCSDPLFIEKLSLSEITKDAPTNRVTLKYVIEELVQEKFINKVKDPEDTRKFYILPTDKLLQNWLQIIPYKDDEVKKDFRLTFSANKFNFANKANVFWNTINRKFFISQQLLICKYNLLTDALDIDSWLMLSLCRRTLARDFPPDRDYKHKMLTLSLKAANNALVIDNGDPRVQANNAGSYLHKKNYAKCNYHCELAVNCKDIDFYTISTLIYYSAASSNFTLTKICFDVLTQKFPNEKYLFFTTIGLILLANSSRNAEFAKKIILESDPDVPYLSILAAFVAGEYNMMSILDKFKNRLDYIERNFFIRTKVRGLLKSMMTKENATMLLKGMDKSNWWSLADFKKVG